MHLEDIAEDDTAYSRRGALHNLTINAVWRPNQPVADRETAWTREFFGAIEPYQTGACVNFSTATIRTVSRLPMETASTSASLI